MKPCRPKFDRCRQKPNARRRSQKVDKIWEIYGNPQEKEFVFAQDLRKALIKMIRLGHEPIRSVVFLRDENFLVTTSDQPAIRVWSLWDREMLQELTDVQGPLSQARVTPCGSQLIASGMDSFLYLFDMKTSQKIWERETHFGLLCCDLSPDGNLIASGSDINHTVLLWDRRSGKIVQEISDPFSGYISVVRFSPENSQIAVACSEDSAKIYDLRSHNAVLTFKDDSVPLTDLAFSQDGRRLVTTALNSRIYLYDIATGEYRLNPQGKQLDTLRPFCATCCAFSTRESRLFACGSTEGRVSIWDVDKGEMLFDLQSHDDQIRDCVFSPNGEILVTVCRDGTGRIWSVPELKSTKRYRWRMEKEPMVVLCQVCGASFPSPVTNVKKAPTECAFCRVSKHLHQKGGKLTVPNIEFSCAKNAAREIQAEAVANDPVFEA